ncbi:MAG: protoporphyrinogen oxidase, partial [Planctomycetota bacterium]|nr:protoporphyrinogen oxidase [Planctomycetota bacterium]
QLHETMHKMPHTLRPTEPHSAADPPSSHQAIVVGGGPAGLVCAWRLKRAGHKVLLLEAAEQPGGNVRTITDAGFTFECGPHSFMGSASGLLQLVDELGLTPALLPTRAAASARFIVRAGHPYRAPDGPASFLTTGLLSPRAKLRLATEPLRRPAGDERDSALDFFRRRFGREGADILAGAFINGVYAGDPAELSAPAAFPLFWGFERNSGSMVRGALERARSRRASGQTTPRGLFSLQGGLGTLTTTLARELGDSYRGAAPVVSIAAESLAAQGRAGDFLVTTPSHTYRAPQLILATPPGPAATLLAKLDAKLAGQLNSIPMAPVSVVHAGFNAPLRQLPDGFGFLAAAGQGTESLGILFPSRLFDDRLPGSAGVHPGDLLCGFFGGRHQPQRCTLPAEELVELMCRDLNGLFGCQARPDFVRVLRHSAAIPQLVVGHLERVKQIEDRLAASRSGRRGLTLAGNYLTGVGLKDAVQSGEDAAASVLVGLASAHNSRSRSRPEARSVATAQQVSP